MGTIPAGEFKKGIKVQIDNEPYEMLERNFVKPGKGQALYRTKLRNLLRGSLFEKTYRNGDSLETADVHRNEGVYSFRDGDNYVFMDNSTFEQHSLPATNVADDMRLAPGRCHRCTALLERPTHQYDPATAGHSQSDLHRTRSPR
ncbi:MAG UNVERIFIED_CONTAM: hypothetical protein LVR18_20745 [Planctomycetaceae bacterium]